MLRCIRVYGFDLCAANTPHLFSRFISFYIKCHLPRLYCSNAISTPMYSPKLGRRGKRSRSDTQEDRGGSAKSARLENPPASSYFDTLAPELVGNVMRFSSEKPMSDE